MSDECNITLPTTPDINDASDLLNFLVSVPENEIDLLWSNLVIDKYISPEIDIKATYCKVDKMANEVEALNPPNTSDLERIASIRDFIYNKGSWNQSTPFSYDFNNPQGRLAEHKTLDYYLKHKRGNCVSMPLLFLGVAERMDVDLSLITAPTHLQLRYTNLKTGKIINLETTSGGYPMAPEKLRLSLRWTDTAVESGMYIKTLTKKQMVAVMGTTLLQRLYYEDKDWEENIEVAEVILEHYPQMDIPNLHLAASAKSIIQNKYQSQYPNPASMPVDVREDMFVLMEKHDEANKRLMQYGFKLRWNAGQQSRVPPKKKRWQYLSKPASSDDYK